MVNERREGAASPTYLIHASEHRAYPLDGKHTFTIGRDSTCDIVVNEVAVSRRHAELRPEGEGYVLNATGSTPTLLNNVAMIGPHPLQEGDSFLIGSMRFVFTRDRLPVAVVVDQPAVPQFISSVDDRRPTLRFQLPAQAGEAGGKGGSPLKLVLLLAVALLAAYLLYQFR